MLVKFFGVPIKTSAAVEFGIAFTIVVSVALIVAFGIAFTIVVSVALIVAFGIAFTIVVSVALIVAFGIAFTIVVFGVVNSFMYRSLFVSLNLRSFIVNTRKLLSCRYFISFSNKCRSVL